MKDKYVALVVHKWDGCEIKGCPAGMFSGMSDDSIGFMPVFEDINKLKVEYPKADIIKIERDD